MWMSCGRSCAAFSSSKAGEGRPAAASHAGRPSRKGRCSGSPTETLRLALRDNGLTLADTGEQTALLRYRDQLLWTRWYWISVTQNIGGRAKLNQTAAREIQHEPCAEEEQEGPGDCAAATGRRVRFTSRPRRGLAQYSKRV
jgi:hypothetical protein